ncbi:Coiled-coil domain-containing protein 22 [Blomia tropicalis]|nr:Coiled-coil domain-containing protein 22 [Blomia tropicalis]
MEEVDAILLTQLREIGDLDDEIVGISNLDSVQVMKCVAECLSRILSEPNDLEYLPKVNSISESMNMSVRYKYATQLSTSIQDLGYKSEIGYQTFMYGNEHEIRKMLLFLIERIPRDDEKTSDSREVDQITSGSIMQRLKNMNVNTIWIPYSCSDAKEKDDNDFRYDPQSDLHDHYGSRKINMNSINTASWLGFRLSSFLSKSHSKSLQRYAKFKLINSNANDQNLLLPQFPLDILEWNNQFCRANQIDEDESHLTNSDLFDSFLSKRNANKQNSLVCIDDKHSPKLNQSYSLEVTNSSSTVTEDEANVIKEKGNEDDVKLKQISQEELQAQKLEILHATIRDYDSKIAEYKDEEAELTKCEIEYQQKCKLFEATYKSKEELEKSVATLKEQIEEIATTWDQMQHELLAEIKLKKSQSIAQSEGYRDKLKKINQLKKSISSKIKEIQSKEILVTDLSARTPDQWPPGRASYTRRIIEIIGNVKKQNEETKKVLMETKTIQKEINTLNGKIERSFAVSDDTIYREAKQNEWNRKCYKSLALLQTTFDQLLESVSNVGAHLREIRQLEEMVDNERARKSVSNLARINADLQQIKLENEQLKAKTKN